jgi:hypothetical protein
MTFEQLKPLLEWRVGDVRGWTPRMLSESLGEGLPYVDDGEGGLMAEGMPRHLQPLLVGFRHRGQDAREAVCRRFLRSRP